MNPEYLDQIDAYLEGRLDEAGVLALEQALRDDPELRSFFVRYSQMEIDLRTEAKSRQLTDRILAQMDDPPRRTRRSRPLFWLAGAACAVLLVWLLMPKPSREVRTIAWLLNAQNCEWTDGNAPEEGLKPGTILEIDRGLVELRFRSGAKVVLDGPARFELVDDNRAQLHRGKMTARVPESAIGFEVLSPQGKVIDLGTEFGISVGDDGATNVYVFEGQVDAEVRGGNRQRLHEKQGAQLKGSVIHAAANNDYVRAIVPPPVIRPQEHLLDFARPIPASILDRQGQGTGFTQRLKSTGFELEPHDRNLLLRPGRGLELTTTNSDINHQIGLATGEYLGIRLADHGFTGSEDFEIVAEFPDIPALRNVGQFGLYAGTSSSRNIRGGLISKGDGQYRQFVTNNNGGQDANSGFTGLFPTGTDLRIVLRRMGNRYSMSVENLISRESCTLTNKHPEFLDGLSDLEVGLFGANTRSNEPKTLLVRSVKVTVWKPASAR